MKHFLRISKDHPNMLSLLESQAMFITSKNHLAVYYELVMKFTVGVKSQGEIIEAVTVLRTAGWLCWQSGEKPKAILCVDRAISLIMQE